MTGKQSESRRGDLGDHSNHYGTRQQLRSGFLVVMASVASIIVNAALAVRLAVLIANGTVRGSLIVAAPLLLGLPTMLNVVFAALNLRRRERQVT